MLERGGVRLSGWGRYPIIECRVVEPTTVDELAERLPEVAQRAIPRGNGRSYGDSSISRDCTIDIRRLDRLVAFEPTTGTVSCESGVLLSDVVDTFLPRGWFPPVTPGTKFVTLGGMVASDVHGKNHHIAGSFCEHVIGLDLTIGDGTVLHCSRSANPDLFAATCGGMGLTGVILRVTFRMQSVGTSRIEQTVIRACNLDRVMELFEESRGSTYSVAWIDCMASGSTLGRAILITGEHAQPDDLPDPDHRKPLARASRTPKRLPCDLPSFVLNPVSVALFNRAYYLAQRPGTRLIDYDRYFYPLDAIHEWNRMYGRRGFVQYQCAIPLASSRSGLTELLTAISRTGLGSFLAVLKRFGTGSFGYLSFAMEGYTLALDFPVRTETFALLDRLDDIVEAHGGRVYLTKDARVSARRISAGYPEVEKFRTVRERYDLKRRFQSSQSQRLEL